MLFILVVSIRVILVRSVYMDLIFRKCRISKYFQDFNWLIKPGISDHIPWVRTGILKQFQNDVYLSLHIFFVQKTVIIKKYFCGNSSSKFLWLYNCWQLWSRSYPSAMRRIHVFLHFTRTTFTEYICYSGFIGDTGWYSLSAFVYSLRLRLREYKKLTGNIGPYHLWRSRITYKISLFWFLCYWWDVLFGMSIVKLIILMQHS